MAAMTQDRIERETLINAPVDRVWSVLTVPAFWVDSGSLAQAELREGASLLARNTTVGDYPVHVERIDAPRYLSYRWASAFPGQEPDASNSTLIEFTLVPEGEQTRLRVVESGFAALAGPDDVRRKAYEDNTGGWTEEIDGLRKRAEQLES
jgi:uncharacterized protein YndB with AHSA1/START domain